MRTQLVQKRLLVTSVILATAMFATACSELSRPPTAQPGTVLSEGGPGRDRTATSGAGPGGIFGGGGGSSASQDGAVLGVNAYLWRASLDTVSFLPISSADPFGGLIISDYYTPPETPNERFRVQVYILGRELRSDNIRVSVARQTLVGGNWRDQAADTSLARQLEDTILSRARQLRVAGLNTARS